MVVRTMILHDGDTPVVRVDYTLNPLYVVAYDDRDAAVAHTPGNMNVARGYATGEFATLLPQRLAALVSADYNG